MVIILQQQLLFLLCCFLGAMTTAIGTVDCLAMATSMTLSQRITALLMSSSDRKREALKAELFELVERSSPPGNLAGAFDRKEDGTRFMEIFCEELPSLNPTPNPARSPLFSGEWECIWSSEKEINFLVGSGLFGDEWKRTYQVIDIPKGRLENYILFDNEGDLSVGSTIEPDLEQGSRFNIQFKEASLSWKGLVKLNLPPIGRGWGELLYLDEDIRLQRDIRGDLILAQRVVVR
jgi:hypothetical protein